MKDFVYNVMRLIGDETDDGFQLTVGDNNITVVEEDDDENITLPKIVVRPFISYLPVARAISEDGTLFATTHEGRIQIDNFSTNSDLLIEMAMTVNDRLMEFFSELEILHFQDPYEWEWVDEETYPGVRVNPNYDTIRNIFRFGYYNRAPDLETCLTTPDTWFLDNTGLYVHGLVNQEMLEIVNGRVFPEGLTAQEAGFMSIVDKTKLKKARGGEPEDRMFTMQYEITYVSYRDRAQGGEIDEVTVNVNGTRSSERT